MKKLAPWTRRLVRAGMASTVVATLAFGMSVSFAADHRDGSDDGVKAMDNIPADINDVYAFMNDGQLVLGMTVFPAAPDDATFSDAAVYVFHVTSHPAFAGAVGKTTDILCTFDAAQEVSCWVGDEDYLTGDASSESGLESDSGKLKVFTGLRADPFYFYLDGFNAARTFVFNNFNFLSFHPNGCPILDGISGNALRGNLVTTDQSDNFFATLNTLAIVIEADADLFVDEENPIISVYASTHVKN